MLPSGAPVLKLGFSAQCFFQTSKEVALQHAYSRGRFVSGGYAGKGARAENEPLDKKTGAEKDNSSIPKRGQRAGGDTRPRGRIRVFTGMLLYLK
jgi:hypothetical protein